jgi:hypothetical protein
MSYAIPSYYEQPTAIEPAARDLVFVPRTKHQWVPMLVPLLLSGASWASGGLPALTDVAFVLFTILCAVYLSWEFWMFPRRFGIGGLLLWGGVLCWFCQDYFNRWFHRDFSNYAADTGIPPGVIAQAAFLHILFVLLMSVGLNITAGKWAERILLCIPDPEDPSFFLFILLCLLAIGLSPYMFFSNEPFLITVWHAATACWTQPVSLKVYRDGNLNYNWGAYVGQILGIGEVSGVVAIFYTVIVARTWTGRFVGACIWLYYALIEYQTGRRGAISFTLLPPIALLFIKYQARAAAAFKKFPLRAYVVCGVLTVGLWTVVQIQGRFRAIGLANADLSKVNVFESAGNTMFSEGLKGYLLIPDRVPFLYAPHFPGEGFITTIPETLFEFIIGPIPRALWHDKPIDRLWSYYNAAYLGITDGTVGTTVSHGLVGGFYFKYGIGGVIEGALLVGWLMGLSERTLQNSGGQPIGILMALSLASWLFRTFRDFIFIDLYETIIGAVVLAILVFLFRPLMGNKSASFATG